MICVKHLQHLPKNFMTQTILLFPTARVSWLKKQGVKNPSKAITDDIITGDSNLFSESYKNNLERNPKSCRLATKSTVRIQKDKTCLIFICCTSGWTSLTRVKVSHWIALKPTVYKRAPPFSLYTGLESNHNLAVYFRIAPICAGSTWKIGNFTGWAADPSAVAKRELSWTCRDAESMPENEWNPASHYFKAVSHRFWPW